jgi:hypothetical protein
MRILKRIPDNHAKPTTEITREGIHFVTSSSSDTLPPQGMVIAKAHKRAAAEGLW